MPLSYIKVKIFGFPLFAPSQKDQYIKLVIIASVCQNESFNLHICTG